MAFEQGTTAIVINMQIEALRTRYTCAAEPSELLRQLQSLKSRNNKYTEKSNKNKTRQYLICHHFNNVTTVSKAKPEKNVFFASIYIQKPALFQL